MQEKSNKPIQNQNREPDPLQPVEDMLRQEGYPIHVIENYPTLLQKDMHLAEIFRLGFMNQQDLPGKKLIINPLQARIDRKGWVWVDVMLE